MKLRVLVTKTEFGYVDIDVPDDDFNKITAMPKKRRFVRDSAKAAVDNGTPITWPGTDDDIQIDIHAGWYQID